MGDKKPLLIYIATAFVLATYLIAVWLISSLLHLKANDLWVLRVGLTLIGIVGAAVFLWYYHRNARPQEGAAPGMNIGTDLEIGSVLKRAQTKLKSSKLGKKAVLSRLPAVLLVGDSKSAKTSTLIQSGLPLEHLGGQIYQGQDIVPTLPANLWYAHGTVFIEVGGKLQDDPGAWRRMIRSIRPRGLGALRGSLASRAAIVCFPADAFLQKGARELCASRARAIRQRLEEIARHLGISFPVFVLFTKTDCIPYFGEYTRNFSDDEAKQVLGATFPMQSASGTIDARADRLNTAFGNLILSLCDKRLDLLEREHDSKKLLGIYEFPRELRKLRPLIVQFLADVCTLSELHASPFLRGFYFSGARAVVINEIVARRGEDAIQAAPQRDAEATQMFRAPFEGAQGIPAPHVIGSRKIPHWTFLNRLFDEVLLQDSVAMGASKSSAKTNSFRKLVFASLAALCLVFALALTISWRGNRALEREVFDADRELSAMDTTGSGANISNAVARLDSLRQTVKSLSAYETERPPLRLRFGLYVGHELYPRAREIYFKRFHQFLFGDTQVSMLDFLKRLPLTPNADDDYQATYDVLKGYLITTANHDKSTQEFLAPLLFNRWSSTRRTDQHTSDLARAQFDFYSEELKAANPFSVDYETPAVERARRYLSMFADSKKVYRSILVEAAQKKPPISFNRDFPGSAEVVLNSHEISEAYSKAGWTFMQNAIKDPARYSSRETWVVGDQKTVGSDPVSLQRELAAQYSSDFIAQWQKFANSASIARFTTYKDAGRKLNLLASPQSPLLAMFCLVSRNTAVEDAAVKTAFQSIQSVVPPTCMENKYDSEASTPYINSLIALATIVEQIGNGSGAPNDAVVAQATASSNQAKTAARQLGYQAHLETQIQKLLIEPITSVDGLLSGAGPAQLNDKGKTLCAQFGNVANDYPFDPGATARPASLKDVNDFFQPVMGAFAVFRSANLLNLFVGQGAQLVPNFSAGITLNPAFVAFARKSAAFSAATYPGNSSQPKLSYTLKPYRLDGAEFTLTIDGQGVSSSNPVAKEFVWTGAPTSEVKLTVGGASQTYMGTWSTFEFFADADNSKETGATYTLQWKQRQGRTGRPMTLPDGRELIVQFDLEGPGAPVFQKNYFADLKCVSDIAR
jgi:type VI secretion system protein ImpL